MHILTLRAWTCYMLGHCDGVTTESHSVIYNNSFLMPKTLVLSPFQYTVCVLWPYRRLKCFHDNVLYVLWSYQRLCCFLWQLTVCTTISPKTILFPCQLAVCTVSLPKAERFPWQLVVSTVICWLCCVHSDVLSALCPLCCVHSDVFAVGCVVSRAVCTWDLVKRCVWISLRWPCGVGGTLQCGN